MKPCSHRWLSLGLGLVAASLCHCDCDPEPIEEIRCEFTLTPHDQGGGSQPIDFGDVALGERRTRTATLRNTGTVNLTQIQFDFGGQNGEHYMLGTTLPTLSVGEQLSVPIVFAPGIVANEINHTVLVSHDAVRGVPCSAYSLSLRGGSFERPGFDAGVDAGEDARVDDAGDAGPEEAGRDAGPLRQLEDAGVAFDGAGAFVSIAALQEARSHFAAAPLEDAGVLIGGGYGQRGQALSTIEWVDTHPLRSRVVAHFAPGAGRARLAATPMPDGRVVFSGGLLQGASDQAMPSAELLVFTPASRTLSPGSHDMSTARFDHCAQAVGEQDLLIAFGQTRSAPGQAFAPVADVEIVHLDARAPEPVPQNPPGLVTPRSGVSSTRLEDGRVVFVGGLDASDQALAEILVFAGGEIQAAPVQLQHARYGHAAVLLRDGRIAIFGGATPQGLTREIEIIATDADLQNFTVEDPGVYPGWQARYRPLAVRVGLRTVLVAGGALVDEDRVADTRAALDQASLFIDLGAGGLLFAAPLNHLALRRHRAAAVLLGEQAAFLGGSTTTHRRNPVAAIERFDLASSAFSVAGSPGAGAAFTAIGGGQMLISGGLDASRGQISDSTYLYDSVSETLAHGASLLSPRRDHQATRLTSGLVLLSGGLGPDGESLASTELFNPLSGQSEPGPLLLLARSHHSATLLDDGRVLLCGGSGSRGDALESCEIYDDAGTARAADDQVALVPGFMSTARAWPQATALDDDHVLISGGSDPARGRQHDDIFIVSQDRLRAVGPLPAVARRHHLAVQVGLGRVLLAGGEVYNGGYLASDQAELFDLDSEQYLSLPPMIQARIGAAGTLLLGGAVLLSGGTQATPQNIGRPYLSLHSSELYDPTAGTTGAFVAVDVPLRSSRGRARALQIGSQALIVSGLAHDGRLKDGAIQLTPRLSIERFDPEAQQP